MSVGFANEARMKSRFLVLFQQEDSAVPPVPSLTDNLSSFYGHLFFLSQSSPCFPYPIGSFSLLGRS